MLDFIPEQFRSIKLIPLGKNTKIARIKWGTNDTLEFNGKENGYAIDCGRSNLLVIDCDHKTDANGVNNFLDIHKENTETFPTTYSVNTPNGGTHFYYTIPNNLTIASSAGTLAPGVDVRANGGYIVGPYSTIKNDNGDLKQYTPDDDEYIIEEAPEWLLKLTKAKEKTQKTKTNNTQKKNDNKTKDSTNKQEKYTSNNEEIERKNALDWGVAKMSAAVEGERNVVLNHVAYFLGIKRVSENDAQEIIRIAIASGLSQQEAEKTFEGAYSKGTQEPVLPLDVITKEYNTRISSSFKNDPLDTEFYTHTSLSYNFYKRYQDKLLYYVPDKSWYEYDETKGIWSAIGMERIISYTKTFIENLLNEIRTNNKRIPITVYRAQEKLWQRSHIESISDLARSDFFKDNLELFDQNPYLINCKNGVFDLTTSEMLEHDRSYFLTKYIPLDLNLDATDSACDKVLESIAPDQLEYMQIMVGQSLVGEQPRSQVMIFLYGTGSNGKSTLIDLMLKTSGNYARLQAPNILLPDSGRENYALADFEGLRTAIIEELPDSKQLNSGALKRLVGTQRINARKIYGMHREFNNQSTIFVSCNRLPIVADTDSGTWRRLVVVDFPYSYKKHERQVLGEFDKLGDQRVMFAAQRNRSTAEAFLAWRVRGVVEWYKTPEKCEISVPESIESRVLEWNENNDFILGWFNDCIRVTPLEEKNFITLADLFQSFNEWIARRGQSAVSMRTFIDTFKNHTVLTNNRLVYKRAAYVRSGYHRSIYQYSNNKETGEKTSYIENIAFK